MLQNVDRAAALIQKAVSKVVSSESPSSFIVNVRRSATIVALSAFEAQPDVTETTDHEDNELHRIFRGRGSCQGRA
jgi:hypothetical protein